MVVISQMEKTAREYQRQMKDTAKAVARIEEPRYGTAPLDSAKELEYWMAEDTTVPVDQMRMAGYDDTTIGIVRFPHRLKLMKSGERALSLTEQARYADRMSKRMAEYISQRLENESASQYETIATNGGENVL